MYNRKVVKSVEGSNKYNDDHYEYKGNDYVNTIGDAVETEGTVIILFLGIFGFGWG